MKIVCDSCGAKYSIADEKVAGKIFKIRCKRCSSVLEVRGDQESAHPFADANAGNEPAGDPAWYIVVDGEPYESVFICVTDGLIVTTAPNTYGEWVTQSHETPQHTLMFDDYWYDDTTVSVGDCYNWAGGILMYSFGAYKLEPFAGTRGIGLTGCAVEAEAFSFGQLKALYR